MALSDELAELRKPVLTCGVCRWYAEQSETDRAEFDGALADGVPMSAVFKVCKNHGLGINESTFRKHVHGCGAAKS